MLKEMVFFYYLRTLKDFLFYSITYVTCTKILESDCVYAILYLWPYDQLFHYEDLLFFSSRKYEEQVAFV